MHRTTNKTKASKGQKQRPSLDTVIAELMALENGLLISPTTPIVAGVDEAGRGCLAGPVVAGAVILPSVLVAHSMESNARPPQSSEEKNIINALTLPPHIAESLTGLADSKKLSEHQRDALAPLIRQHALAWGLGVVWPSTIDKVNILQATFLAMARAVYNLRIQATYLLIDGNKKIPAHAFAASRAFQCLTHVDMATVQQHTIIGGDDLIPAISAASILAKTYRDTLMVHFDKRYPVYGFARHKGYGTKDHLEALRKYGPCAQHRLTFRGVMPEKDHTNEPVSLSLW